MDKFSDAFERWLNIEPPLQGLIGTEDIPTGESVYWSVKVDKEEE
jgi:hypothetical protein